MPNTQKVLAYMFVLAGALGVLFGWVSFCMWLTNYSMWGLAICYAPFIIGALAWSIRKDLKS